MADKKSVHAGLLGTGLKFAAVVKQTMMQELDHDARAAIKEAQDSGGELVMSVSLDGVPGLVVHLVPPDGEPSEIFCLVVNADTPVLTRH